MTLNIYSIDPDKLHPAPAESADLRALNEEEKRVLNLVIEGLESGSAIPVDDAFFERLRSRFSPKP
jgi:hypothetical protein